MAYPICLCCWEMGDTAAAEDATAAPADAAPPLDFLLRTGINIGSGLSFLRACFDLDVVDWDDFLTVMDLEELDPFVDLPIFPEDFNKARGTRRRVGLIVAVIVFIVLFDAPMSINNMNGNGVGFYWLA